MLGLLGGAELLSHPQWSDCSAAAELPSHLQCLDCSATAKPLSHPQCLDCSAAELLSHRQCLECSVAAELLSDPQCLECSAAAKLLSHRQCLDCSAVTELLSHPQCLNCSAAAELLSHRQCLAPGGREGTSGFLVGSEGSFTKITLLRSLATSLGDFNNLACVGWGGGGDSRDLAKAAWLGREQPPSDRKAAATASTMIMRIFKHHRPCRCGYAAALTT